MAKSPSRTALHEAAHCLILHLRGVEIISATVRPSRGYDGIVEYTPTDNPRTDLVAAVAGSAADGGDLGDMDTDIAQKALAALRQDIGGPVWQWACTEAHRLVRANHRVLVALADALEKCETMTGDEVHTFLRHWPNVEVRTSSRQTPASRITAVDYAAVDGMSDQQVALYLAGRDTWFSESDPGQRDRQQAAQHGMAAAGVGQDVGRLAAWVAANKKKINAIAQDLIDTAV